nr:secreted RxLR effector protein 161-like [Nicotiana tomentosiformis]
MESSKSIDTPIATATRLDMDELGSSVNETMYRSVIGSLIFQSSPKESHLKVAKRILMYLKGTQDLVLYYPSGDSFDLIGYAYADYAGYLVDRKSTFGMAHFLGSCLISWGTKKQNSMALSTIEAEYVAASSCCAQLIWIKQQLEDFGVFSDFIGRHAWQIEDKQVPNDIATIWKLMLTFSKFVKKLGSYGSG